MNSLTEADFVSILEAARLGVCSEEIKEEMEISDEEAARLHEVIVSIQENAT